MQTNNAFTILNRLRTDGAIGEYALAGSDRAWRGPIGTYPCAIDILMCKPLKPIQENPVPDSVVRFAEMVADHGPDCRNFNFDGWTVQFLPVATVLSAEAMERAVKHEIELKGFDALVRTRIIRPEHFGTLPAHVASVRLEGPRLARIKDADGHEANAATRPAPPPQQLPPTTHPQPQPTIQPTPPRRRSEARENIQPEPSERPLSPAPWEHKSVERVILRHATKPSMPELRASNDSAAHHGER